MFSKFVDKDNDIELTQHLCEKNKFCHTYFAPVLFGTYRVSTATMQANTTADFAFFLTIRLGCSMVNLRVRISPAINYDCTVQWIHRRSPIDITNVRVHEQSGISAKTQ